MARVDDAQAHLRGYASLLEKLRPEVMFALGRHELRLRLAHYDAAHKAALAIPHGPTGREAEKRALQYLLSIPYAEYQQKIALTDERMQKAVSAPGMSSDRSEEIRAISATRARLQSDYAYSHGTAEAVAADEAAKNAAIGPRSGEAAPSASGTRPASQAEAKPLSPADIQRIFREMQEHNSGKDRLGDERSTAGGRQPVTASDQNGRTTYTRTDQGSAANGSPPAIPTREDVNT